jgi:transcriptional regulator with XRE-family HTH domain
MKFQNLQGDAAVLQELGQRMAQLRIDRNLTQEALAQMAGVGKRTLERMEAGETTQTRTLFRIFRELDLLEKLDLLLPEPTARPSLAIRQIQTLPKRATKKRTPGKAKPDVWKWGDET